VPERPWARPRERDNGTAGHPALSPSAQVVAAGLLGALATGRILSGLLYQVSPRDPLTYGVVVLVLAFAAILACWIPARRASAVDPQKALQTE